MRELPPVRAGRLAWVTTLTADWDDAPDAYTARTTKLVLHRPRLFG